MAELVATGSVFLSVGFFGTSEAAARRGIRATLSLRAKPALECGRSSYRLPPSAHTMRVHGAEEERR